MTGTDHLRYLGTTHVNWKGFNKNKKFWEDPRTPSINPSGLIFVIKRIVVHVSANICLLKEMKIVYDRSTNPHLHLHITFLSQAGPI